MELLQRKNTSIKKLREMIFGKRTERHQARKAEGQENADEAEKSDDGRPKAAGDQDARAELRVIESGQKWSDASGFSGHQRMRPCESLRVTNQYPTPS